MRSHHLTLLALSLVLVASPGHAEDAPPADALEDTHLATLKATTGALSETIAGAIAGDADAREALLGQARSRARVDAQLTRVIDAAAVLGPGVQVSLTGLEVRGSLWWGLSPVWDLEIFYWLLGARPSVLRMTHAPSRRALFSPTPAPAAPDTLLGAVSAMSDGLTAAIGAGRCDDLPVVSPDDYASTLPREARARLKTTAHLDRFRQQVHQVCATMSHVPAHRTTWSLGDAAVVLEGRDGRRMSLRIQFARGSKGQLTIRRITTPVAPTPQTD